MEYQLINGLRRNAVVLWSPGEKNLYIKQVQRNGNTEYICYQKTLHDNYKKEVQKGNNNTTSCENKENEKCVGERNKKKQITLNKRINKHNSVSKYNKKMNGKKHSVLKCNARAIVGADKECHRNKILHSAHGNHEHIYNDMVLKNKIIDRCLAFKDVSSGLSLKVPTNDIFTLELAK